MVQEITNKNDEETQGLQRIIEFHFVAENRLS